MNKKDLTYIVPNSVLGISNDAFNGCSNLTTLTIPNSVTNIGTAAFKKCTNLTSLVISENITSIDTNLFKGCTNLKTITIPSKITNLTVDMFDGCVNLNSIIVDENNSKFKTEDGVLFDKGKTSIIVYPAKKTQSSYTVPDSVVSIGANSFLNCKDLSTIIIPRSVTSIEKGAFQGCTNLKSVMADNNTQYLGENGVLYNKAKTNIIVYPSKKNEASYTIPGSVTVIEDNQFNGNSNLTSIVISSSISSIFTGAFIACNNLDTLNVVDDNMYYSSVDGILFNKEKTSLISYPVNKIEKSYTIPSGVSSIAIDAFKSNRNLMTINIPSSVKTIEGNPFLECTNLEKIVVDDNNSNFSSLDGVLFNKQKTEILAYPRNKAEKSYNIPTSVININSKAFYKCQNLSSVVIPNSTTNLERYGFKGCTNLVSLTIPMSVTIIGKSIENRCEYLNEFFIDENDRSIIEEYGEYKLVDKKSNYKYVSIDGVQFTKEKIDIVDTGDTRDTSLLLLTLALVLSLTGLICYNTKSDYTY